MKEKELNKEKITWITMNGNHIPIMPGQSEEEAINDFLNKHKNFDADENKPQEKEIDDGSDDEEDDEDEFLTIKPVKNYIKKKINNWNSEDCLNYLLGTNKFDEEKIKELNPYELKDLTLAQLNIGYKSQEKHLLQKDLEEVNDKYHIWKHVPLNLDELVKSIELKKEYFGTFGDDEKLAALEELESKYSKYIKQERRERRIQKRLDASKDLINKYINSDGLYSQQAKDEALWFQSSSEVKDYYKDIKKDVYSKISQSDLDDVTYYTSSFSFINEPLRKIHYIGSGKKSIFLSKVKGITNAIDKSPLKDNMWIQRGTSEINLGDGIKLSQLSESELESFVGKTFKDHGFVSCGTAKGKGFSDKSIIMNIYCPKGTKALYVDPISNYGNPNESIEEETIIQRGYSYKITRLYHKDYKTYMDCDVILGSDEDKYNDEQLKEIKEMYF